MVGFVRDLNILVQLYFFLQQIDELNSELEELRELSAKRLDELEKKTNEHKEALKEVEKLKMDVSIFLGYRI